MARHVHEDALDDDEFEKLLAGAKRLDPPWNLEAMFIVFAGGRLGLRVGEIAHLRREWVSFETAEDVYQIELHNYDGLLSASGDFETEWIDELVDAIEERSARERTATLG